MEQTTVIIVGAGPSGLVLGLSLARLKVHSIILEKDNDITEDPRGVYLAGDAIRVLWQLGISSELPEIGHEPQSVCFHKGTFITPEFFKFSTDNDHVGQTVPSGVLQCQPKLESALRNQVKKSLYCEIRCGCEVISREEHEDGVTVGYRNQDHKVLNLSGDWFVGADGKRGVVRKKFLEKSAGIKQGPGLFLYEGTWIAANLHITLPTKTSHPTFPLWKLGFTPQEVYDLYWPVNWHFLCPPRKPTACGRFGPHEDRLWRHEFAEPEWDDSKDADSLLWEQLRPLTTRRVGKAGTSFPFGDVSFPEDCIHIMRCRPFTFAHKVVNKWFHNRTILIGDAAHVFPPFGGQGLAAGIRDAEGLAWRLAVFSRIQNPTKSFYTSTLSAWAVERREGVDDSTRLTLHNGDLVNNPETWGFFFLRVLLGIYGSLPFLPPIKFEPMRAEINGYKAAKDGFFLPNHNGGIKMAQIYLEVVNPKSSEEVFLSDSLFNRIPTVFMLMVIDKDYSKVLEVESLINDSKINPSLLSAESIVLFNPERSTTRQQPHQRTCPNGVKRELTPIMYCPAPTGSAHRRIVKESYDPKSLQIRIGMSTKYAIIRPDNIVVCLAKDTTKLKECLRELGSKLV